MRPFKRKMLQFIGVLDCLNTLQCGERQGTELSLHLLNTFQQTLSCLGQTEKVLSEEGLWGKALKGFLDGADSAERCGAGVQNRRGEPSRY